MRPCNQPAPKYGGHFCAGPSTKAVTCQARCPGEDARPRPPRSRSGGVEVKHAVCLSVQWTGSGPAGPAGASVPRPAILKAVRPRGPASAPALTPPPPPARLAPAALATGSRRRTASTCPPAPVRPRPGSVLPSLGVHVLGFTVSVCLSQWTAAGASGRPSRPVPSPVGWGFRCQTGNATVPPPTTADGRVPESSGGPESAGPTSTVQVRGRGKGRRHGNGRWSRR